MQHANPGDMGIQFVENRPGLMVRTEDVILLVARHVSEGFSDHRWESMRCFPRFLRMTTRFPR